MASVAQTIRHERTGGMDRGVLAHQINERRWRTMFNMRPFFGNITQVPLKKVLYYATPFSGRTLNSLVSLPDQTGQGLLVGLTEENCMQFGPTSARRLYRSGVFAEAQFEIDTTYRRWGTTLFNDKLFFVNDLNACQYTDGSLVYSINNAPRGTYCEVFYDHLVIGRPIMGGHYYPQAVAWSDLNNFQQFTPDSHTEADSYFFTEYQNGLNVMPGVTGVAKLGNVCLIYTATCVYMMQYTGLPKVVKVDPLFPDIGNGLKYGLVPVSNTHFIADFVNATFLAIKPDGFEDIGGSIRLYFMETVNKTFNLLQRTWGYYDPLYQEVVWVYISTESEGEFDRAIAFNLRAKEWSARSVENYHCFTNFILSGAVTCDELPNTCDELEGTCDELSGAGVGFTRAYGGKNERLMVEETPTDSYNDLLVPETPYLETGDFPHESFHTVKEVDRLLPQTTFIEPTKGVELQVAKRKFIKDSVEFVTTKVWDPEDTEHDIANLNPKQHGRILRYRFMPHLEGTTTIKAVAHSGLANFQMRAEITGRDMGITTEDDIPIRPEDLPIVLIIETDPVTPPIPVGEPQPVIDSNQFPKIDDPYIQGKLTNGAYVFDSEADHLAYVAGWSGADDPNDDGIDADVATFWRDLVDYLFDQSNITYKERYLVWRQIPSDYGLGYTILGKYDGGAGTPVPDYDNDPTLSFGPVWILSYVVVP